MLVYNEGKETKIRFHNINIQQPFGNIVHVWSFAICIFIEYGFLAEEESH